MRAFVINAYAHPSQLKLTHDAPEPKPGPNDVIVEVYSAALNFFDILQAQGKYQDQPPFPFVLGCEFAGRIASHSPIPPGCPYRPGDRVFGLGQGTYADRMATPWNVLLPIPKKLSFDQASGLPVTWPTSYEGLVGRAQLKAGEWVLVHAGAGGVGLAAVQVAKAMGAKVIATAGSPSKMEVTKKYGGADHALDYTKPGWQKEVMKLTGGKGVDVIYDPVGLIRDSLKCIAWKGRAVVVGFVGGEIEKLPLNLVLLKNIAIVGVHCAAYVRHEPSRLTQMWKEMFELIEQGKLTPVVFAERFKLEDLPAGLVALENRKTWGKVVARVRDDDERSKL